MRYNRLNLCHFLGQGVEYVHIVNVQSNIVYIIIYIYIYIYMLQSMCIISQCVY